MLETDNLKRLPASAEAERALLCCLFLAPEKMGEIVEILEPEDFTARARKNIYRAMLKIFERGEAIDVELVSDTLKRNGDYSESGGEETLGEILESVPTSANILSYAKIVQDKARLRRLGEAATKIVEEAYAENDDAQNIIDRAESYLFKVTENKKANNIISMPEALKEEMDRIDKVYKSRGIIGISTGYSELDAMTGGLQDSNLIIIAARPSMGKSAFAQNIALNAALDGKHIMIFSLEMSQSELLQRFLAMSAKINLTHIGNSFLLGDDDFGKLGNYVGKLAKAKINIVDSGNINELEIRTKARRYKSRGELDMIIIDYLQLIRGRGSGRGEFNRQQEVSEISRSLKGIARELNVPIIALSQLSRSVESRNDRRPLLSDLRESGSIEQDADVVMFLYRDEYYLKEESQRKGITDVIIAKHRNGPTGDVSLRFFGEYVKFTNLEKVE
ncbi:MAG: replicative DNA helicase [Fusobacteriaceae bacterium]|jgi:replicative DNA helicase|nr:replicative DNA helicase [Fusobacteriaceae bacterium]